MRALLVTYFIVLGLAIALAQKPFTVEQLHALRRVSSPAVNSRGDLVWSERVWTRAASGSGVTTTNLYVKLAGGSVRQLTNKTGVAHIGATFSADGNTVFFLGSNTGSMQLYSVPVNGGEPQQITEFPIDIDNIRAFSNGGQQKILYTMKVYYSQCSAADLVCTAKADQKVASRGPNTWKEYESLFVRHWDEWEVPAKASHIFVQNLNLNGGKWTADASSLVDVMAGLAVDAPVPPFGGLEQIDISPQGDAIAYTGVYKGSSSSWTTDWKIFTVNLKTLKTLLITDFPSRATNPIYSPNGKWIAYLAMNRPGHESDKLHVRRYDTSSLKTVTITNMTDISFGDIIWDKDSQSLIGDADWNGLHSLFSIDMMTEMSNPPDRGDNVILISPKAGSYSSLLRVGSSNTFIAQYNTMMAPTDLFSFSYSFNTGTRKGSMTQIIQQTSSNAALLRGYSFSTPERLSFTGALGETVYGWVLKPFGFTQGKTYPVVNLIHGGPEGSWGDDWSYRWNPQLWSGHGYGVIMIDFHGSTGYGQNFTESILGNWGSHPYEDIMLGVAAAIEKYDWMDSNRFSACGASYGGYMVNWIQGHTDFFKALVTHNGLFDTYSSYFTTDELWFPEAEFLGAPWETPEIYDKWNPMNFVTNWKTPHLIIHGQNDYRLVLGSGLSAFTALQRQGVPSKLLYFTMENHWVLSPENGIKWYHTVLDWLDKWSS